jgi:glycosyltransferase involved in cell wall biosynthesis
MRIHVVEPDGSGGLIHYAHQLCGAMAGIGAEVTLVTGRHFELADLPRSFRVEPRIPLWPATGTSLPTSRFGSTLVRFARRLRRAPRALRYAWAWSRLTAFLARERPDVVQFSVIRFPFQVRYLRRLRRRGITLTQICHEFEDRERGWFSRILRLRGNQAVFECFDRIYLHGESTRDRFHATFDIPRARTAAIRHGTEQMFIDLAGEPRPGDGPMDPPTALFFGGLRPSKGIEDLIAAWEQVRYEVEARLVIAGEPEGVDPAALQEQVDRIGVSVSVTILPEYQPIDRVAALMRAATVVVLPYRSATASGVLHIAYAFGRPVVATALGALAEDVIPGETGLLVPPGDTTALARALIKMLADPAEASRMGDAAAAAVARFGWDAIARTIIDDYGEMT